MNQISSLKPEAFFARISIFIQEIVHIPLVVLTGLIPLALMLLFPDNETAIILAPVSVVISLGLHAACDALIRRQWAVYLRLTDQESLQPSFSSRLILGIAHGYSLIFQLAVVWMSYNRAIKHMVANWPDTATNIYASSVGAIIGAGVGILLYAASYKPKFENNRPNPA